MVEIPDSLRAVFSGSVRRQGGSYVLEIPATEIENRGIGLGEPYRVAIYDAPDPVDSSRPANRKSAVRNTESRNLPRPPVSEGEVRDVTIEAVGEQGDGIAKVDDGYVVIVTGAEPGDNPTVEIENVERNVAFASVLGKNRR